MPHCKNPQRKQRKTAASYRKLDNRIKQTTRSLATRSTRRGTRSHFQTAYLPKSPKTVSWFNLVSQSTERTWRTQQTFGRRPWRWPPGGAETHATALQPTGPGVPIRSSVRSLHLASRALCTRLRQRIRVSKAALSPPGTIKSDQTEAT